MKKTFLPAAIGVLVVAAMFVSGCDPLGADDTTSLKGTAAPAINLKTIDGKDVSLGDMKGKVVLVDMWATWCPPCRESLPHVQSTATDAARAGKGLVVWTVNDAEKPDTVTTFLKQNNYSFTVLMDSTAATLASYHVSGIPTTVVVGRDGTVKDVFVGYGGDATGKAIDAAIDAALAESSAN
jgi:thiol-disulfide isomerase/thioredoxin